ATLQEADTDSVVLPYVNTANPSQPFSGPANSGTSQPTTRKCTVQVSAKAGTAATTGTQVTPAPDSGYVGLWVVTVANGAVTVVAGNISQYASAPYLFKNLAQLPAWVQSGQYKWAQDTGTANAIVASVTPAPPALTAGMIVLIKKVAAANSGNVTLNLNG